MKLRITTFGPEFAQLPLPVEAVPSHIAVDAEGHVTIAFAPSSGAPYVHVLQLDRRGRLCSEHKGMSAGDDWNVDKPHFDWCRGLTVDGRDRLCFLSNSRLLTVSAQLRPETLLYSAFEYRSLGSRYQGGNQVRMVQRTATLRKSVCELARHHPPLMNSYQHLFLARNAAQMKSDEIGWLATSVRSLLWLQALRVRKAVLGAPILSEDNRKLHLVARSQDGSLHVLQETTCRGWAFRSPSIWSVVKVSSNGYQRLILQMDKPDLSDAQSFFTHMAVDSLGNYLLLTHDLSQILTFSSSGQYVTSLMLKGYQFPYSWGPHGGIAIDAKGRVWVADYMKPRITAYDGRGQLLATFSDEKSFSEVADMAFDSEGRLWVLAKDAIRRLIVVDE